MDKIINTTADFLSKKANSAFKVCKKTKKNQLKLCLYLRGGFCLFFRTEKIV